MLKGISASNGIAIGKAFILKIGDVEIIKETIKDGEEENQRFITALEKGKKQLSKIMKDAKEKLGEEKSKIFEAHLFMLDDPEFTGQVSEKILKQKINAEYALKSTSEELVAIFEQIEDDYMRERVADIKDVTNRILRILTGNEGISISEIEEESILIGYDLTPSDTAQIDKNKILGFATEIGGVTSHSAIIARSIGIPSVLGVGKEIEEIKNGELIILDGNKGLIITNPDDEKINLYKKQIEEEKKLQKILGKYKNIEVITLDGRKVEVASNIGSIEDSENALKNGAEGIGLFRTEFLYMASSELPEEEFQYNAYKEVLEKMGEKPVIIRTLDIGGDKKLSYLTIDEEMNPFLGYRAIRLCLHRKDIFKTQLRALLRASYYGNLKIMFPMIANLQELREAKSILEECKEELRKESIAFNENIKVGIMVEIPSAAIMSDVLAKEVDFFSIGTNDLIQYTIAVDRMNEKVSYLYDFFNPAVLRLINNVIVNGHKEGKFVGMCGEMAGKKELIPLLLGMGLDEFSMSASSVLKAKKLITELNYEDCKKIVSKVMEMGTAEEVKAFLERNLNFNE
ncbi:phosphoenolpyruvate--protein phosphotransferase [Clostridium tetani]|uniref:Phosphoenolpyruvate-protein phosphotransferase n=1 Tax=Clostridium tetani (strain Massachusetts / E88) TaxID=212717 RepID=Q893P2_CLOTE|nr:phosphoenolpyruvate--protein phosphotransferase [Clostridium tetani]AAO36300.1 phosphoenolpyruvate-protein phosphotransferase [Clostridium tetani E88]KGI37736.1 phosphoenolpyruvate-protein phosphotransferase [Clostridium tetani]KGI45543.1 phosphoenolpyruvate-protein phosphotransferase [Clostridium tetani]KHO31837.1 phosphoenolpyruvate-protein phosphotransferase [Clostridium tetani]KIG21863.1 phosphoenolpyruvate-protein phosphotransferase [Clostridium tetani]